MLYLLLLFPLALSCQYLPEVVEEIEEIAVDMALEEGRCANVHNEHETKTDPEICQEK